MTMTISQIITATILVIIGLVTVVAGLFALATLAPGATDDLD